MALNPLEEDDQHSLIIQREQQMVPVNGGDPTWKTAHFLKPIVNPTIQPLPEPPSLSPSSNPNIIKKVTKMVDLKSSRRPLNEWKAWVDKLEPTHRGIWQKVGIFDAIKGCMFQIRRHKGLILVLAQKWCPETNTFVFPLGECTVTLEDVIILGGFSVLGVAVHAHSTTGGFEEIKTKLLAASSTIKARCRGFVTHNGWMNYFKGQGGQLEHVAFLVLWLSRYVFPTRFCFDINLDVFDIAISLAKGIKIALAPAVLASIYRDLRLLKKCFATFTSGGKKVSSKVVVSAPLRLVNMWAWERFPCLGPKTKPLMLGDPRLARWHNMKELKIEGLGEDFDVAGDHFLWKPYALQLNNWEFPKFYTDEEGWILVNSKIDDDLLSFARCLRACELVGMDCLEKYFPHRVAMQFGMDQDIPDSLPGSLADKQLDWSSCEALLDGWRFYVPHRLMEGDVTLQYSKWWKGALAPDDSILNACSRREDGNKTLVGDQNDKTMAENEAFTSIEAQVGEIELVRDDGNRALVCSPHIEQVMALDFSGSRTELLLVEQPACETVEETNTMCDQTGSSMAANETLTPEEHQVVPEMKQLGGDENNASVCSPINDDGITIKFVDIGAISILIEQPPRVAEQVCDENEARIPENHQLEVIQGLAHNSVNDVEENDTGKGKHIVLKDHQEMQKNASLKSGNEVGPSNLVVINDDDDDDENDDSVSKFLDYVSGIEDRIRSLNTKFAMLKRQV